MKIFNAKYLNQFFIIHIVCLFISNFCGITSLFAYSFNDVLHHYRFISSTEKESILYLLKVSSVFDVKSDLLFIEKSEQELLNNITCMIKGTQEKFVLRSKNQERWEVQASEWMQLHQSDILFHLNRLGIINGIEPVTKNTDVICIFGATGPTIIERLNCSYALIESGVKTKYIVLLGGERYVTKDIDSTEEQLTTIAQAFHLSDWKDLTETHLFEYYCNHSLLNTPEDHIFILHTLKGDKPRPTTETTLVTFIEWLKSHPEIKHIIFISNQPHVNYQKAMVDLIFKKHSIDISYEVVGCAAAEKNQLKLILAGLGALGSYLWAYTPIMLSKINIKNVNEELINLYVNSPFIYNFLINIAQI